MNSTFFFMSFTWFSRIHARTGIRAPNKRKHWKFSTRAHFRKMYTNTTAQTGQKRSIQIHFREDVHPYCKSKRLRNGSPPTPPPLGTWMERLQALKVLSDIQWLVIEMALFQQPATTTWIGKCEPWWFCRRQPPWAAFLKDHSFEVPVLNAVLFFEAFCAKPVLQ